MPRTSASHLRPPGRDRWAAGRHCGADLGLAAAFATLTVLVALSSAQTGDYGIHAAPGGDNPAPALAALTHLDLGRFVSQQPLMGLVSIMLRAPVLVSAVLAGAGNHAQYELGALVCLLPAGAFACWLVRRSRASVGLLSAAIAGVLVIASPAAFDAVRVGHPEELLAAVLATAAVLAAIECHDLAAAALLACAIATKQWAVIAAPPVILAVPGRRLRTALLAAAVALPLTVIVPLADPGAFARASRIAGGGHVADAASAWWPLGSPIATPAGTSIAPTARLLPLGLTRSGSILLAAALVIAALGLATGLFAAIGGRTSRGGLFAGFNARTNRGGRPPTAPDPLAVLVLLGIIRCACDPGSLHYYYLAAIVPLAAWETVRLARPTVLAAACAACAFITFGAHLFPSPGLLNTFVLAWTAGLLLLVGGSVAHPRPMPRSVVAVT